MRAFVSMHHSMVSNAAIFLRLEIIEFNQLESNKSQTSILVHQEMQDSRIDEFFCRLNEGKFFPFCISRHFYSISIYKNGLRKNPSPFIYSHGMPINTGGLRLKDKCPPFITLHQFAIFRFLLTAETGLMLLLRFVRAIY